MAFLLLIGLKENTAGLAAELQGMGYGVTSVASFEEAEAALEGRRFSLLLFVEGPGSDREEIKALAQKGQIPVLALLGEGGLEGAPAWDDFLLLPYRPQELRLRLRRLITEEEGAVLRQGELAMDLTRYQVTLGGRPIDLTYKEYQLLKFLMERPDIVHTRETLLNRVWGYDYFGGTRTVDVHIRRLRSKLEAHGHSFIETVRNVGYRLKQQVSPSPC